MSVVDDNKHQQTNPQPATEESTAALSNFNKLNINKPGTAANAKKHAPKPKAKDDRPRPWRLRPLALMRYYAPPRVYRPLVKAARTFNRFWGVNSGDWQWMAVLGIPLGVAMRDLIVEERARSVVGNLIRSETETFGDTDIRRLRVDYSRDGLSVYLEVAARVDSISDNQVELVHAFLEREMERPIELDVSIFPAREIGIEAGTQYTTRRATWRERIGRMFER